MTSKLFVSILASLAYLLVSHISAAFAADTAPQRFQQGTTYQTCFTPGQACETLIASKIGAARKQILIQAYSFTSKPIAAALIEAKKRGVEVIALLDKSQRTEQYTSATFIANAGIPVRIDDKVTIAHNKVIVIDSNTVVTGSYNFTKSAQERNAENVFIINGDNEIAKAYTENFSRRWQLSVNYR
jgi:phosphatidylserine/phosphatidylglycerophosphate/cardiolipin synthase-like enzyme